VLPWVTGSLSVVHVSPLASEGIEYHKEPEAHGVTTYQLTEAEATVVELVREPNSRALLRDMTEMLLEDGEQTKQVMIEDKQTLHDFDSFVDVMQRHDINMTVLRKFREALDRAEHE
jgi:hypothetical protein